MKMIKNCFYGLTIILLLVACNKEKKRITSIYNVYDISYSKASIQTLSELPKKENCVGGLCWGQSLNPTNSDNIISDRTIQGTDNDNIEYFHLENLIPGTVYHIRSFLNTTDGFVYSEDHSFVTDELPSPPCVTPSGFVDFEYFTNDATDLILASSGYYGTDDVAYTASSDYGSFRIFFNKTPVTGLYQTVHFGSVDMDNHIAIDFHGGSYNCYYETPFPNDVYVTVDNGVLSIRFCELTIASGSGLCSSSFVLSGELHN